MISDGSDLMVSNKLISILITRMMLRQFRDRTTRQFGLSAHGDGKTKLVKPIRCKIF